MDLGLTCCETCYQAASQTDGRIAVSAVIQTVIGVGVESLTKLFRAAVLLLYRSNAFLASQTHQLSQFVHRTLRLCQHTTPLTSLLPPWRTGAQILGVGGLESPENM